MYHAAAVKQFAVLKAAAAAELHLVAAAAAVAVAVAGAVAVAVAGAAAAGVAAAAHGDKRSKLFFNKQYNNCFIFCLHANKIEKRYLLS